MHTCALCRIEGLSHTSVMPLAHENYVDELPQLSSGVGAVRPSNPLPPSLPSARPRPTAEPNLLGVADRPRALQCQTAVQNLVSQVGEGAERAEGRGEADGRRVDSDGAETNVNGCCTNLKARLREFYTAQDGHSPCAEGQLRVSKVKFTQPQFSDLPSAAHPRHVELSTPPSLHSSHSPLFLHPREGRMSTRRTCSDCPVSCRGRRFSLTSTSDSVVHETHIKTRGKWGRARWGLGSTVGGERRMFMLHAGRAWGEGDGSGEQHGSTLCMSLRTLFCHAELEFNIA